MVGAGIIANPGELRLYDVGIGGTSWKLESPDHDTAKAIIKDIASQEPGQARALQMFSVLCRAQLFSEGNKRTAQLIANKMLITDGAGILAIPVDKKRAFETLLVSFCESGNPTEFLTFIEQKGLDGIRIEAKE